MFNPKPEWTIYTFEETASKRRVGPPNSLLIYDKGLSTTFKPYDVRLPQDILLNMNRLRRRNIRSRLDATYRNLYQALIEIERLSDKLHLPRNIKEVAAFTYRKAIVTGLAKCRSITAIAAASIYAACRITGTPRTLKDIAHASPMRKKEIARYYRMILRDLNLPLPIDDPVKYLNKIASKLGISPGTQLKSVEILHDAANKKSITGKIPIGVAASALYLASILTGEKVTQHDLAEASDVTKATIRNISRTLRQSLDHVAEHNHGAQPYHLVQ